ncbi:MAG: PEP-CTERM sorting domain-containing protein [Thermodesulfobacteriota bacterium]|nr:PEP-CTERM sorting domain-containing protein [Thermodesulfobacteriota bacterium]
MKNFTKTLLPIFTLFLVLGPISANAVIISDGYWGADPIDGSERDIVGADSLFNISQMEVTFNPDGMYVDIYTTYLNNITEYGTELGDLFISTDGWTPNGNAPYTQDNVVLGGETWEYVLAMDNHRPNPQQAAGRSGNVSLYQITGPGDIKLSWIANNYVYRQGQEVQYRGTGEALAFGTWSIGNWGNPDTDDFLRFVIDFDGFNDVSQFGFHWGMTCANDVIEGGTAPVPEPATMLLFGAGLVGLAVTGRRKARPR